MSLFEWLGESFDPGGSGAVEFGGKERPGRARWAVLVCLILALGLLGGGVFALWRIFHLNSWPAWSIAAGGTLAYLVLGYYVHPEPDYDNIGWLGGLLDHPFRYSDDINRTLIFLTIVLLPGRFIAESLVDSLRLFQHVK